MSTTNIYKLSKRYSYFCFVGDTKCDRCIYSISMYLLDNKLKAIATSCAACDSKKVR